MTVSIIGAGNHSQDIQEIWFRARGDKPLSIYDDNSGVYPKPPEHLSGRILIGVNDPHLRREIAQRWSHLKAAAPLIDPSAIIGSDVAIDRGSVVAPLASILRSTALESHVHINTLVSITRAEIGSYTTVSPGATICGNVTIGTGSYVGANATICERVKIGKNVMVGAGAIVLPYSVVPSDTTVVGVWSDRGPL